MVAEHLRLRSVSARSLSLVVCLTKLNAKEIVGHALWPVVRVPGGTLSVWTGTRRVGPYRGWACSSTSRNVSLGAGCGFAIRETVVNLILPPYVLLTAGRSCVG